ncbi:MAG: class II fructose-bisphosphatase [Patescibacteria group bacterium]|mgnify:CR=1 FL=1
MWGKAVPDRAHRDTTNGTTSHLALDFVRVTELAAIAAAQWIGKGDGKAADTAAVDAMRNALNEIDFTGEIVIGEGAKDESAELFVGEKLGKGNGGPTLDIAVDPLECTDSVAFGRPNALTVIATGPKGSLYHAADSYMDKIAVGPKAKHEIQLDASVKENITKTAKALGKSVSEITVAVLDRPRHATLINEIRETGARVQLFTDGDIAMAIATCLPESPIDLLMGIGGSAEGVISAAAMKCLGGEILAKWKPKDATHIARLKSAGVTNFDTIFNSEDLAKGNRVTFTATGVISGPLIDGVVIRSHYSTTHSVVMSSNPRLVRFLETRHLPR